ncbi:hypothetical protein ABS230_20480, partial [Acinetobacter baumannii]
RTGEAYKPVEPTTAEPTTAKPTAAPTTQKPTVAPTTAQPTTVQPTTAPVETYTLYFKTNLGWMTSDGVSLFAYDLNTGIS